METLWTQLTFGKSCTRFVTVATPAILPDTESEEKCLLMTLNLRYEYQISEQLSVG